MKRILKNTFLFFLFFNFFNMMAQPYYPGGVSGAEVWFAIDHNQLGQPPQNWGNRNIKIMPCNDSMEKTYFNFNYSVTTGSLCFQYKAPLERDVARNIFFVGIPSETRQNLSHLTTASQLTTLQGSSGVSTIARFDFSNKNIFNNNLLLNYDTTLPEEEVINFYNWNNYQVERKEQSYGSTGETLFSVGKNFTAPAMSAPLENSETDEVPVQSFSGNFPEFISFPFELTNNQRERVDSYLALKYGVTLQSRKSYIDSQNTEFWRSSNNARFKNNVFGIGSDRLSNLNQLQSKSVHGPEYLVASVKPAEESNPVKQQSVQIDDRHFIVFGNNDRRDDLYTTPNDFDVRFLQRIWLSQNTGEKSNTYPMSFIFTLPEQIQSELTDNPTLKLWMLHDQYTNNSQESSFNSQYVEYYEPTAVDNFTKGYFDEVYFDTDTGKYDQFTFGVGPEMIVQARFNDDCQDEKVKTNVIITGGKAPYKVNITNTNGYNEDFTIDENTMTFEAEAPYIHTIYVQDSYGNEADTELEVILPDISLDLEPLYTLTGTPPTVTINAGVNVNDPNATYQWYLGQELLDFTGPVLTATQWGKYTVVITSGNRMCTYTDMTTVAFGFSGTLHPEYNCDELYTSVKLNHTGGIGPYTAVFTKQGQAPGSPITFNSSDFLFQTITPGEYIPAGQYSVVITDFYGAIWGNTILVKHPLEGIGLDLTSQLIAACGGVTYYTWSNLPFAICSNTFSVNASQLVTNPYASYEWFVNGISLETNNPILTLSYSSQSTGGETEYRVVITNDETGCTMSQAFAVKSYMQPVNSSVQLTNTEASEQLFREEETTDNEQYRLKTKIYPNPSDHNATFYYEISATEVFSGIVEIYSTTGALVKEQKIEGQANYTIPFYLLASGTYFVRTTTTNGKIVSDKIVIK